MAPADTPATPDTTLDVRHLAPPEPLERALDAVYALAPGQRLRMRIDRDPHPLHDMLEPKGYRHTSELTSEGSYLVTIWRP
ncbi:MAG: DUF2249 domain-containing protein [Candidimonas sp.]|nr:MAG: DUF2249 domain-containing protein [Candidimonas sp.]